MDISALLRVKQIWETFCSNHPKFPGFAQAVKDKGITEGTEILISVTYPDGVNMKAGIKVRASDLDLVNLITSISD